MYHKRNVVLLRHSQTLWRFQQPFLSIAQRSTSAGVLRHPETIPHAMAALPTLPARVLLLCVTLLSVLAIPACNARVLGSSEVGRLLRGVNNIAQAMVRGGQAEARSASMGGQAASIAFSSGSSKQALSLAGGGGMPSMLGGGGPGQQGVQGSQPTQDYQRGSTNDGSPQGEQQQQGSSGTTAYPASTSPDGSLTGDQGGCCRHDVCRTHF
jgi:hypothetical protein